MLISGLCGCNMSEKFKDNRMKIFIMDTIELPIGRSSDMVHKLEIARNLSKLGHEVHVMTYVGTKLEGTVAHPMKAKEEYKISFVFKIMHLINILKVIHAHNFDILYTRNVSFGLLGFFVKKMITKSKLVLELNGLFLEDWKFEKKVYGERSLFKSMKMVIMDHEEIFAAKKADAVIPVTEGIKDILIKRGVDEHKITAIPNGANADLFRPINNPVATNELRCKHNVDENAPIVMFVGSLVPYQGVEYLIQSAPLILKKVANTMFLIIGDGRVKNELMNLVKKIGLSDKFVFIREVPYEEVPLYINMADVCMVPKKPLGYGYSPLKLYEYMACGKPVIASDIEGFEILEKYNAGIILNPEDPEELSNAIIKLLQNKQLREQMGTNGRELVVGEYSWESAAKKTVEVLEKTVNR